MQKLVWTAACAIGACGVVGQAGAQCDPDWLPRFLATRSLAGTSAYPFDSTTGPRLFFAGPIQLSPPNEPPGIIEYDGNALVSVGDFMPSSSSWPIAMAMFDPGDGGGERLYAASRLSNGDMAVRENLGGSWSDVPGTGAFEGTPREMFVFDDGSGEQLYIGGDFDNPDESIRRFDGTSWEDVGQLPSGARVNGASGFIAYDDGTGTAMYVAGGITDTASQTFSGLARWNGTEWARYFSISAGFAGTLRLEVFDSGGGNGPELYIAGDFQHVTGGPPTIFFVNNMARVTNGSLGHVGTGTDGVVHDLEVFDDGTGEALFLAGEFTQAGGVASQYIAKWDGSSYHAVASPFDAPVRGLASTTLNGHSVLVATGEFTLPDGVAIYDGTSWRGLDNTLVGGGNVEAGVVTDLGAGPTLFLGGDFDAGGGGTVISPGVIGWDGASWIPIGHRLGLSNSSHPPQIEHLTAFDDGSGMKVAMAGEFDSIDGAPATGIATFDGTNLVALPALAPGDDVAAMGEFGGALYVAVAALDAEARRNWHVKRLDSGVWVELGGGFDADVAEILGYDDGAGERLYIAGAFSKNAGVIADQVAIVTPTGWEQYPPLASHDLVDVVAFDDGTGSKVYGLMNSAGGTSIHVLDSGAWAPYSTVLATGPGGSVASAHRMVVHAGALHILGNVQVLGTDYVARWGASTWEELGGGLLFSGINDALSWNDGSQTRLIVAGDHHLSPIQAWDGVSWQSLGVFEGEVDSVSVFDFGAGPELVAVGFQFYRPVPGENKHSIARIDAAGVVAPVGGGLRASARDVVTFNGELHVVGNTGPSLSGSLDAVVRFDGADWHFVDIGLGSQYSLHAATVVDQGSGPVLWMSTDAEWMQDLGPVFGLLTYDGSEVAIPVGAEGSIGRLESIVDPAHGASVVCYSLSLERIDIRPIRRLASWDGAKWNGVDNANSALEPITDAQVFSAGSLGSRIFFAAGLVGSWDGLTLEGHAGPCGPGDVDAIGYLNDRPGGTIYALGTFDHINCGGILTPTNGMAALGNPGSVGAAWEVVDGGPGVSRAEVVSLRTMGDEAFAVLGQIDSAGGFTLNGVGVYGCEGIPEFCPADWNGDGSLNDQDFFDWVNDYFNQAGPQGHFDFNLDGNQNDQDWFDFVNAYFNPAPACS